MLLKPSNAINISKYYLSTYKNNELCLAQLVELTQNSECLFPNQAWCSFHGPWRNVRFCELGKNPEANGCQYIDLGLSCGSLSRWPLSNQAVRFKQIIIAKLKCIIHYDLIYAQTLSNDHYNEKPILKTIMLRWTRTFFFLSISNSRTISLFLDI